MKTPKTLEELKESVEHIIDIRASLNTKKKWLTDILDGRCNTIYWILDTDANYFNIHVHLYDVEGCVRVYEHNKELKVQIMRPITMKYSGISTFPSARKR
jgi:ribosome-interacting GTPase 1